MEDVAKEWGAATPAATVAAVMRRRWMGFLADPGRIAKAQVDMWTEGLAIWQRALGGDGAKSEIEEKADKDKRFSAPEWRQNPLFDMIRQSYVLISDHLLGSVAPIEGLDAPDREKLPFATRSFVDEMIPSHFPPPNPPPL